MSLNRWLELGEGLLYVKYTKVLYRHTHQQRIPSPSASSQQHFFGYVNEKGKCMLICCCNCCEDQILQKKIAHSKALNQTMICMTIFVDEQ